MIYICTQSSKPTQRNRLLNHVKLNQIWIVITFFRLILQRIEIRPVRNQSVQCNYKPNLVLVEHGSRKIPRKICDSHSVR